MKYSAFILLLFFPFSFYAQIVASYGNSDPITQNRYANIQGVPYQFDQWMPGKIYDIEGEIIEHSRINYNAENGKFEVENENGAITIINEIRYSKIEIRDGNKTYTFANRLRPKDITYYQLIFRGEKIAFLEKLDASINRESKPDYSANRYIGSFKKKSQNYILKDGQIHEIYRSKKKILKFMGSDPLKKFVKTEKLNLRKDEDLKKALRFYEEINEK